MKEGDVLTDGKSEYKVLAASGGIVWVSFPDEFGEGMRMYSAEDLAAAGIRPA